MSSLKSQMSRKYRLQYDEVRGDLKGPLHMHFTQAAVEINIF